MTRYVLSWDDPAGRLYDIAITFIAPADDPLLHLPAWRPGRYLIQNYAANVRDWSANLVKIGKSSWRAAARAGAEVTVRYRYFAGFLDAGSSFLDDEEAYFNGSNLFMMIEALRSEACTLEIATTWPVETQLPSADGGSATPEGSIRQRFLARNYDHLIDSPAIASPNLTIQSFEESGAAIRLVFLGGEEIDTARFVEPVRAIVRSQAAVFGGLPLRSYRFLYHLTDRWHGVEHEESASITCMRTSLLGAQPGEEGFDHFLSITAHEFFHLWNVKRILPAVFVPYDYLTETPTGLLWVMEGVTSYYGELSLVRAGLWNEQRYLTHLAAEMEVLENSAGRDVLSLEQASFDAWLQDPAQMHDKTNAWISFYNKGEIVSALLDITLRARGRSLDEVMQTLWRDYGRTGRGLEEDAFERAAGEDLRDFFGAYVRGTKPLPYEEVLALAGLAVEWRPGCNSFGGRLRVNEGSLIVESVRRGGAAMEAGILPGDEVLSIASGRVRCEADVLRSIRTLAGGDFAEVLTVRAGVVRPRQIEAKDDGLVTLLLRIDETASEGQHHLRGQWLRRSHE